MDPKIHAMHQRRTSEATVEGVARLEAKLDQLLGARAEPGELVEMSAPLLDHATSLKEIEARLVRIETSLNLLLSGLEVAVPAAKPAEPEAQPEAPAADDDHATGRHRRHAR